MPMRSPTHSGISLLRNLTIIVILNVMEITHPKAPDLADWVLARGRTALTSDDVAEILDVPRSQVSQRLHPRVARAEWVSPAQGLWIPVPPQYRLWGAPPGMEIIDQTMQHLSIGYYVGWLSAAALYGATHQAVQVFQVATARPVRDRQLGRTRFAFHTRRGISPDAVRRHETPTGYALVSTITTTALDVATDTLLAGGLDNAATVIIELSEHPDFDVDDVARAAHRYPVATARRLGWILENLTGTVSLDALHIAGNRGSQNPSRLNPARSLTGVIDKRWNVSINDEIEDES